MTLHKMFTVTYHLEDVTFCLISTDTLSR